MRSNRDPNRTFTQYEPETKKVSYGGNVVDGAEEEGMNENPIGDAGLIRSMTVPRDSGLIPKMIERHKGHVLLTYPFGKAVVLECETCLNRNRLKSSRQKKGHMHHECEVIS